MSLRASRKKSRVVRHTRRKRKEGERERERERKSKERESRGEKRKRERIGAGRVFSAKITWISRVGGGDEYRALKRRRLLQSFDVFRALTTAEST